MRIDRTYALVLLCFLLSGFAGLLFETVWTRQFAVVFGTSDLAVATVLAAYMGGLAAGAAVARRLVLRTSRPLVVYGVLELGIGLAALAVPAAIGASRALCLALFGGQPTLPDSGAAPLSLFYLASSFLILLVPTSLMGATLPLLARFAVRRDEQIGSRVGALYATNTSGAVLGTLVTAFLLLPNLSLERTVWVGVALNFTVFALALLAARDAVPAPPAAQTPGPLRGLGLRGEEWVLPLLLVAGVTSFSYEVLWTRLLSHVFGGTVYAFGTMLASFLTGIALGSVLASRRRRSPAQALQAFSWTQVGVATCSVAAFLAVDRIPELAVSLGAGSHAGLLSNAAVAALVLLPGALFIGASFPLVVLVLSRDDVDASPTSARVYAWNTVGAIIGSIGAGFVWMPWLGYDGTLAAAAAANLLVAAAASALATPPRRGLAAAATAGAAALMLFHPGPPWQLLLTSALDVRAGHTTEGSPEDVVYFAAGRGATVMLRADPEYGWGLLTNGLPEAGIRPHGVEPLDDTTQWLGGLPVLVRPGTRSMLVIGLGGGTTLETIASSVDSIDVVELEAEVVEANRVIAELRARDPLSDPRVQITVNDARGALMLTERRWDAVVSQPSHPWTAGASHLFTREFFELVRSHLNPGGVFVQWMGVDFMDLALLRSLLATLNDSFPNVQVYWVRRWNAALFAASDEPIGLAQNAARALAELPEAFVHLGVHAPEDVATLLVLDESGVKQLARNAPVITDAQNLFTFLAPRALRDPMTPDRFAALLAPHDPLAPPPAGLDAPGLARRLIDQHQAPRALRVIGPIEDPATRETVAGLVLLADGRRQQGQARLRAALALDPGSREARVGLVRWLDPDGTPRYASSARRSPSYPELEVVARGWHRAHGENWSGLAELEGRLAAVAPVDPLFADALRLRALWRIEVGDPGQARRAAELLDMLIAITHFLPDVVLRSRAATAAGEPDAALGLLKALLRGLDPRNRNNVLLLEPVTTALAEIPENGMYGRLRDEVAAALLARKLEFSQVMPEYFD